MMQKYRVIEVAKDFSLDNKKTLAIINQFSPDPNRKSITALSEIELNLFFNYITAAHQVDSFDAYFIAGDTNREARKKEKEEAKAKKIKEQEELAKQLAAAKKKEEADKKSAEKKSADKKSTEKKVADKNIEDKKTADTNKTVSKPVDTKEEKPVKLPKPVVPAWQKHLDSNKRTHDKPIIIPAHKQKTKSDHTGESRKTVQEHRIDTRQNTADLSKYSEKYDKYATASKYANAQSKQKLHQRSQNYRRPQGAKRETEADKLRKLQLERLKARPIEIVVGEQITVGELASRMKKTAADVVKKLMVLGVMAAVTDVIDYDTAEIVATEMGARVSKEVVVTIEERIMDINEDKEEDLVNRDPVVVVMGHVDHGKTSLLDKIRSAGVVHTEAGGITQHIGAYRVPIHERMITFLDTPGHAAFTAMRQRGASVTDVAILVVAADDGIMPQTIEAINHAKAAGIQIIVAINKMDKEDTNPDKIMQQLTEHELVPEEWGGETICVPVSAHTGLNIDKLLESVILVADMQELTANPNRKAKGTVIEARLDKGRGPIATVLVQNGTLKTGDIIVAGDTVGRVRTMNDDFGIKIDEAGPSVPVEITGLTETPSAGDIFDAVSDERLARELVDQRKHQTKEERFGLYQAVNLENLFDQLSEGNMKDLNLIIKADVQGSVEALKQSLLKLSNEEVKVKVIHGAVGAISESDVMLASTSGAIIIGFNVRPDPIAELSASSNDVDIRFYSIIYDAIEEIEAAVKGMLAPKYREVQLGKIECRVVYNISSTGTVAGCYVLDGKVIRGCSVRVMREGIVIADDKLAGLKRFKDDVKEVASGYECGLFLEKHADIKEGDVFEAYMMEEYRD